MLLSFKILTTFPAIGVGACRRSAGRTGRQHVTGCAKTRSGGLPQLDPVALRIGDPAESTDTVHVLRVGRFGWVTDPEGNRIELWQPA